MQKNIGIIMYQSSSSKGQELVAQRMVSAFNEIGQKAYLITSQFHDHQPVLPVEDLKRAGGYRYIYDEVLNIPVIRVDSSIAKWPPRRINFMNFIDTLKKIVDQYSLNVLITHSTLWNGPEETAKFVIWRRNMLKMGGSKDAIVFVHMSHLQEATIQRYSINELTFRTAWNKFSLSQVLEAADIILAVTPYSKSSQEKLGAEPEKFFLFPGGVDAEELSKFEAADNLEFINKYGIGSDKKIVSYLGTIEKRKNPVAILKVAEKLKNRKDIHFVIAGRGSSPYAERLYKSAVRMANVTFTGEIDEKEKVQLIRSSYLNIILSHLEALGITQLEFMYYGVPVITSGAGGQSWLVRDCIDGLHVKGPDDVDGAASEILCLAQDETKYRQLSENAIKRARKYTIMTLTKKLDAAIDRKISEILNDRG